VLATAEMTNLLKGTFKLVHERGPRQCACAAGNGMTEPAPIIDFFSVKKVREKISNLRTEAASGLDGIGSLLLQELSSGLAPALTTTNNNLY
jgi:hypothetical protein